MKSSFSISDLAGEFDVTTRTIRFYEEKGLLNPQRDGTRRIYSPADRTKLRLILRGKRLGLSLDESAEIILMYGTPGNNRRQLETLISKIHEKRVELKRQQSDLRLMLKELADAEEKCRKALKGRLNGEGTL
ncbi:MAG: MerR family DNA-binding transcriptional regulator [Xanthomonadales bacterium]|nr:MerR family DNA-binding transcriptional regulator [Gammaproteobacteria bacterium]MBT8053970.1 MerR family DNA-binding transcriptional regulator [Gammaproteobacteria bacterium]NND58311.1 MerR family DNA-binding transcriptional regulator [Xanthomonadales bacterium]NNK51978.1 MerR family DNA-binding transcriptional regulator [Xanthomonadales bacterium]